MRLFVRDYIFSKCIDCGKRSMLKKNMSPVAKERHGAIYHKKEAVKFPDQLFIIIVRR